ncbi:hypothetical protein MWH28_12195 [Natroniella sulfidigena]|uniref:hypothetical protein n=1 Tax=Natroniella sulfidigena TaxID=723921 RepID=UPI00200AA9AD|nr:hypothetical protein [Natroniella sulfidigena]MCK8818117.1 hypothetical protein [Natroniella sulfidigena]
MIKLQNKLSITVKDIFDINFIQLFKICKNLDLEDLDLEDDEQVLITMKAINKKMKETLFKQISIENKTKDYKIDNFKGGVIATTRREDVLVPDFRRKEKVKRQSVQVFCTLSEWDDIYQNYDLLKEKYLIDGYEKYIYVVGGLAYNKSLIPNSLVETKYKEDDEMIIRLGFGMDYQFTYYVSQQLHGSKVKRTDLKDRHKEVLAKKFIDRYIEILKKRGEINDNSSKKFSF